MIKYVAIAELLYAATCLSGQRKFFYGIKEVVIPASIGYLDSLITYVIYSTPSIITVTIWLVLLARSVPPGCNIS